MNSWLWFSMPDSILSWKVGEYSWNSFQDLLLTFCTKITRSSPQLRKKKNNWIWKVVVVRKWVHRKAASFESKEANISFELSRFQVKFVDNFKPSKYLYTAKSYRTHILFIAYKVSIKIGECFNYTNVYNVWTVPIFNKLIIYFGNHHRLREFSVVSLLHWT